MLRIGLGLTVFFTAVTALFPHQILSVYTEDMRIVESGVGYLRIMAVTYLFLGLFKTLTIVLRSEMCIRDRLGGVSMIVAMLGIIAGRMIIEEYAFNKEVDTSIAGKVSRYKFPVADLAKNVGNIIRSFLVGVFTGFLPALGGGVASMICYATEKNRSEHPETFGNGEPAGIIACETTNNAVIGGALIPMISMGIPGSPALIYMITALSIHGISCGPTLLRDYPDVV